MKISIWTIGKLWCILFAFYSVYANRFDLLGITLAGLSLFYHFEHVAEDKAHED